MGEDIPDSSYAEAYPFQWLCFWLGAAPLGLTGGALCQPFDRWSISSAIFGAVMGFILLGFPTGLVSLLVGYFIQDSLGLMNVPKKWRLLWLILTVPTLVIGTELLILFAYSRAGK
jgi:hypothetical protein